MRLMTVLSASIFVAAIAVAAALLTGTPASAAGGGGSVNKCGGGNIWLNANEKQTFVLHNQVRKDHDLKRFCVNPKLQKAARSHSEDMIKRDYFSHDTKGRNESACERVERFGYRFRYCAENIAYGSGSYGEPRSRIRAWMKSDGHRHNILNGKFHQIGIGTETGNLDGKRGTTMYTVDFGTPR